MPDNNEHRAWATQMHREPGGGFYPVTHPDPEETTVSDQIERQVRYKQLARKLAEGSFVTDALARLIEQIIAEVHDSRIEPQAARIAELEAEVARLRSADSWQPGATAPRTGVLLIVNKYGAVSLACWNTAYEGWDDGDRGVDGEFVDCGPPLWWKPAPVPPALAATNTGGADGA